MIRRWFSSLLLPTVLIAQSPTPTPRIQRLAEIGRLWGHLKWVHPALAEGTVDWDKHLVETLPAIAAAETVEAQEEALRQFMSPLNDPSFRIGPPPDFRPVKAEANQPLVQWLPGEVALLNLNSNLFPWDAGFKARVLEVQETISRAKGLVLDLRPTESSDAGTGEILNAIVPRMIPHPLELPAGRYFYSRGWPAQSFSTSGNYFTAWLSQPHEHVMAEPGAKPRPMVFIINRWTPIPPILLALQKEGLAYIVSESKPDLGWVVPVETVRFGNTLQLTYRVGDLIHMDGTMGFGADRVVDQNPKVGPGSPAVEAARALLSSRNRPGVGVIWVTPEANLRAAKEKTYLEMLYPDLAYRQLAVIKFWVVIDAFFPYRNLMDRPWEDALPVFLTRMEHVRDAREYVLAMAEMAGWLQDNHVHVSGHPEIIKFKGEAMLPVGLSSVEGQILVEKILDPGSAPGVKRWDEVLRIDGIPVQELMKTTEPYIAFANPWTRDRNLTSSLGRGELGKEVQLTLRGADGQVRSQVVKRFKDHPFWADTERDGDVFRILPGNIGYADLDRLETSQVDALLEMVKECPALILDMRGYPRGTAWTMAPRLNVKNARPVATFYTNVICGTDTDSDDASTISFLQKMPDGQNKSVFKGKVIMLISEETQSQAEHTGLFMEAACGAIFIGSPSAGSNGDVTDVILPGGLTIGFTGEGIRHADGRQLQRVGLKPDILVHRTVNGLRAGRDEVLERAIRFIETGK